MTTAWEMPVTRQEVLDHTDAALGRAPYRRHDLLVAARTTGARAEVLAVLARLPEGPYRGVADLVDHLADLPGTP